jgi:hypothetical protein
MLFPARFPFIGGIRSLNSDSCSVYTEHITRNDERSEEEDPVNTKVLDITPGLCMFPYPKTNECNYL